MHCIPSLIILLVFVIILFLNSVYKVELFIYKNVPGDYCKGVTPDPIPNSAVKPFSANGTLS